MERHFIGLKKSFMPRWHIRYSLSGINFPIGASCLNRSGTGRVWHTGSKLNPVLFMPVSLPELSSVEVYVIHQMHLAEFFLSGNQFGREEARFCVIFTQNLTGVFRRSLVVTSNAIRVVFTTASMSGFGAINVQSLHKIVLPPHHRLK
jgi:hypothetical protein